MNKSYFEQKAEEVGRLSREEVYSQIKNFKGRFKLDFTDDYLDRLFVDRLRHILLAAQINKGHK